MLKFSTEKPIYTQIVDLVQARIIAGVYPPQSQLPSVRDFAIELGVNPNTVQRALSSLEQAGFVRCERTAGRFVTGDIGLIQQTREALMHQDIMNFVIRMRSYGCSDVMIADSVRDYITRADGEQ